MEYRDIGKSGIVLGVTGSIAAYKACELVRIFQKSGIDVRVAMTENAQQFVSKTTFASLTGQPVATELFGNPHDPIPHIELVRDCEAFVIAPCTANMIAKLAHGIADDIISAAALACTAPIIIAPAMNTNMYEAAATKSNLDVLKSRGVTIVEPASGALACGAEGKGHLADPSDIADAVITTMLITPDFAHLRVLVTTGATVEPIDPVRFISNKSSGKMGFEIASAAARRGADVLVVSGRTTVPAPPGIHVRSVESAEEMYDATTTLFPHCDILVCAAAVTDYRPSEYSSRKLKKGVDEVDSIVLSENPDTLAACGSMKNEDQIVVGFAAETEQIIANAQKKLVEKNADLIVANDVKDGKVFDSDFNKVIFVRKDNLVSFPEMTKTEVAEKILDQILEIHCVSR